MTGDWHLHTCFSNDSETPVEAVIETAIKKGMKELCITDHCDFDLDDPGWILDADRYIPALREYREKYADRIKLHIGVEIGLNPEYKSQIDDFIYGHEFEYVIGSIHTVDGLDPYHRDKFDMNDAEFYKRYFVNCAERIEHFDCFDTFGHLDYAVRYGYDKGLAYRYENYADEIDTVLKYIISKNKALEINTAGLRKGLDFVHPHPDVLARYVELGGKKVQVGSDAHRFPDIGFGFEEADRVIEKFGLEIMKPDR